MWITRAAFLTLAVAVLPRCASAPARPGQSDAARAGKADGVRVGPRTLHVARQVACNDPRMEAHVPALRESLERSLAAEGFLIGSEVAPGTLLVEATMDFQAPSALESGGLYLSLNLSRDGDLVDQVQTHRVNEGFPSGAGEVDALTRELASQLALSPRLRDLDRGEVAHPEM